MANYKLSNEAKRDLKRIHQFGIARFGLKQADKYFDAFFEYFDIIANNPLSFETVEYYGHGCHRCVCGSDSIFYNIQNDSVEIIRIIGQQNLNDIFN